MHDTQNVKIEHFLCGGEYLQRVNLYKTKRSLTVWVRTRVCVCVCVCVCIRKVSNGTDNPHLTALTYTEGKSCVQGTTVVGYKFFVVNKVSGNN